MALKQTVTKAEYSALHETIRGEYMAGDNDNYNLMVEGADDLGALKRALDHEKEARKTAEKKARELAGEKDAAAEAERLKNATTVAEVTAVWEDKYKKLEDSMKEERKKAEKIAITAERSRIAKDIATEVSTVPSVMQRVIADRLHVDIVDGVAITRVLSADGKASAATLEDLKSEILANKEYAPIVIASKASGSGAPPAGPGNGSKPSLGSGGPKISEMTEQERIAFHRRDPAGFKQQSQAEAIAARGGF